VLLTGGAKEAAHGINFAVRQGFACYHLLVIGREVLDAFSLLCKHFHSVGHIYLYILMILAHPNDCVEVQETRTVVNPTNMTSLCPVNSE